MEPVETRALPCKECNRTGHCSECKGTGRVDGEECYCYEGKCMVCMGTGRTADFYYRGKPVTFMTRYWWRVMLGGVLMLASGVAFTLVDLLYPGRMESEVDPIFISIIALPMGVIFTAWSIHLWRLRRMVDEAEKEFYRMQYMDL